MENKTTISNTPSQEELGIIGRSEAIQRAVRAIRRLGPTDLTVLIEGESGAGKEVFANALYRLSKRSEEQILSINCGAIPESLLESELFGHEKGAFTGAVDSRKGLFEAADGGTIFLDEIGEMAPGIQVKFLRVLETLEFSRVGSNEVRKTDVRIIAATNKNLEREVDEGRFRNDLFYRLNSARIYVPPLRERKEDIQLLFALFAYRGAERLGIDFPGITPEAMNILIEYPWPGNVRELRNFTELVITLQGGEQITPETIFEHLDTARTTRQSNPNALVHLSGKTPEQAERELIYRALIDLRNEVVALRESIQGGGDVVSTEREQFALPPKPVSIGELTEQLEELNLESVERGLILKALQRFGDNRRRAADALGISERTLYRKLHQYKEDGFLDDDHGIA